MKLKLRVESKDLKIFFIFSIILLYFAAILVLNLSSFTFSAFKNSFINLDFFSESCSFSESLSKSLKWKSSFIPFNPTKAACFCFPVSGIPISLLIICMLNLSSNNSIE